MSDFSARNNFNATFGTFYSLGGDYKIIRKANKDAFPSVGNEKYLYIADDTNLMYLWDEESALYTPAKSESTGSLPDVLKINGGNAGSTYLEHEG